MKKTGSKKYSDTVPLNYWNKRFTFQYKYVTKCTKTTLSVPGRFVTDPYYWITDPDPVIF